jgi:hypothetical protein
MGRLSKRAAVEHACSGRALMCHVMGAGCCSDQYAPPRALPNVRECGTVRTDTVVYVPTPGQTPGLAEKKRGTKRPGHGFRHVAQPKTHRSETTTVGSLLRCVHTIQIKLRGRQGRQDLLRCASIRIGLGWLRPEGAQSAICALLTPFITYKHTLQHTNRLRCPSRL